MKFVLIIAVAAVGGTVIGDMIDERLGAKLARGPVTRKAVRVGFAASTTAVIFGVLNAVF